jgi:Arc/MetJ-type ribon-helix-helix transcriptional regulator
MSTDANGDSEMVKLNVKVPRGLLDELDELAAELEYTNRSEFVREVLRETTEPMLTPGAQAGIEQGYADIEAGRTQSLADAKARLGLEEE